MPVELALTTRNSIRNTSLCATDGSVQYHIQTPFKWTKGTTTTITKWVGPKRELVATIDWKRMNNLPTTTFRSQHSAEEQATETTNQGEAFLQKISILATMNRTYNFTTPEGTKYVWHAPNRPELKRASDSQVVANYRFADLRGDFKGSLMIEDELMKYLDYVVASFVIIEHFRQYEY